MKKYDLIVIGSGVGLSVLSQGINQGLNCALIESGKMGGTCLTRGCIPSKVLVHPADLVREAEHAQKVGIKLKLEKIDWSLISKRMWHQIDESKDIDKGLSNAPNLDVYKGTGEFTKAHSMKVKLNDGTWTDEFQGEKIVIASGTRSFIPPIKGIHQVGFLTNESFFGEKFPQVPWNSLLIIGGGIIAAEFAHIFSAMGTQVTIIEMLPRLVSTEEPEVSKKLEANFKKHMTVMLEKKVIEAKSKENAKILVLEDVNSGEKTEVKGQEILIAAGRKSNADILRVDDAGIKTDKRGWITVNEHLETNVDHIWCIGDANGKYQFRHTGNMEADVANTNVFSDDEKVSVDYQATPWAIFTWPQIGHVGLTEQQAIEKGYQIFVAIKPYSSIAKGFAMGYDKNDVDDGFVKLVISRNRKILGAHVIGPNAAILVQQLVYLMKAGIECYMPDDEKGMKFVSSMACPEAGSIVPLYKSQVIHPSLNEVVGWSLGALRPVNIDFKNQGHKHHHEN